MTGFLDPADSPFKEFLKATAPAVRDGLARFSSANNFMPRLEKTLYDKGRDVFGFCWFGNQLSDNCTCAPGRRNRRAGIEPRDREFSRLRSGARPHAGYVDAVMRRHR